MAGEESGAGSAASTQPAGTGTGTDGQDPAELLADMASGDSSPAGEETPEQRIKRLEDEASKWKALSRKHEQTAKQNKTAADRLAELEEAQKSEAQKLADRAAAAEQRAVAAERLHTRTLAAAQHELEPDLIPYLHGDTEEDITASAETLARVINERVAKAVQAQQPPAGNGLSQMRRPVESLRPGGAPAGSSGSADRNQMFRDAVLGARR